MNKNLYLFFMLLLGTGNCIADAQIEEMVRKLNSTPITSLVDFYDQIEQIKMSSTAYIKKKETECDGNYKSIIVNSDGRETVRRKRLTKQEKKLCKLIMINLSQKISKSIYEARKSYLLLLHKKQLSELEDQKNKEHSVLEKLADKYK